MTQDRDLEPETMMPVIHCRIFLAKPTIEETEREIVKSLGDIVGSFEEIAMVDVSQVPRIGEMIKIIDCKKMSFAKIQLVHHEIYALPEQDDSLGGARKSYPLLFVREI